MTDTMQLTAEEQATLDDHVKTLEDLSSFINRKKDHPESRLQDAYTYLQVYATYGLRLPNTSPALCTALHIASDDVGSYRWFQRMVDAYAEFDTTSRFFFDQVLTKMIDLGGVVKDYASNVVGQDSIFTLIVSLLFPTDGSAADPATALELLKNLQADAKENADLAGEVRQNLTNYKTQLEAANENTKSVKADVDSDSKVNQDAITKLGGDENTEGSLNWYKKQINDMQAEYKHDVVVASTSVTYAWVVPFGLIAAATVAGVYGDRAVKMKKKIEEFEDNLKASEDSLTTAVKVQTHTNLAGKSLDQVIAYTTTAINQTTILQNAWNGFAAGLKFISDKVDDSLTSDEEKKLRNKLIVKTYLNQAQTRWGEIKPTIDTIMAAPYITVSADPQTVTKFLDDVIAEVNKQK